MTRRATAAVLLTASALVIGVAHPAASASVGPERHAIMFLVHPVSFEDLLAAPTFRGLARAGGAGLMTTRVGSGQGTAAAYRVLSTGTLVPDVVPTLVQRVLDAHQVRTCETVASVRGRVGTVSLPHLLFLPFSNACPPGAFQQHGQSTLSVIHLLVPAGPTVTAQAQQKALSAAGVIVTSAARLFGAKPLLILVVDPAPSRAMNAVGDELTPVLIAGGPADRVVPTSGPTHALTSDTTRQDGLVANVDVAPTILQYFGIPIPVEMDGEPIRRSDGPAPFALHRLHLEHRRTRVPVQLSVLGFTIVAFVIGVAAMVALAVGRLSRPVARAVRFLALCTVAIPLALVVGGLLPHHTYAYVIPFLVLALPAFATLALVAGSKGPLAPLTILGAFGLAFVMVDALFGWRAMRVPLYGGTMFDGGRYYGLPNAFLSLVFAGALFVVWPLRPLQGFVFLLGVGLFVGFPSLGADVGGSITLFAAAGLWWVLRTRRTLRLRDAVFVAVVVAAGLAVVLLANRFLPGAPTHATRFVERAGTSLGTAYDVIRHRLGTAAHQVITQPTTLIPLIGLPVVLMLVLRRPGPLRPAMDLDPRWRYAVVTLTVASFVAFFANDTGASAAAPAFFYAMVGMVYPAMLVAERSRK